MAKKKKTSVDAASIAETANTLEELKLNYALPGRDMNRVDQVLDELAKMTPAATKKPRKKSIDTIDSLLKKPGIIHYRTLKNLDLKFSIRNKNIDLTQPYKLVRAGGGRLFLEQDEITIELTRNGATFKEKAQPKKPKTKEIDDALEHLEEMVNLKEDFTNADANNFIKKFDAQFVGKHISIDLTQKAVMSRVGDTFFLEQGGNKAAYTYTGKGKFKQVKPAKPPKPPKAPKPPRAAKPKATPPPLPSAPPQAPATTPPQGATPPPLPRSKRTGGTGGSQGSSGGGLGQSVNSPTPPPTMAKPIKTTLAQLSATNDYGALFKLAFEEFYALQDDLPILLQGSRPSMVTDTFESFFEDFLASARDARDVNVLATLTTSLKALLSDLAVAIQRDIKSNEEVTHLQNLAELVKTTLSSAIKIKNSFRTRVRSGINAVTSKVDVGGILSGMTGGNSALQGVLTLAMSATSFLKSFRKTDDNSELEHNQDKLRNMQRQSRRKLIENFFNSNTSLKSYTPGAGASLGGMGAPPATTSSGGASGKRRRASGFMNSVVGRQPVAARMTGAGLGIGSEKILADIFKELRTHTGILLSLLRQQQQWAAQDAQDRGRASLADAEGGRDSFLGRAGSSVMGMGRTAGGAVGKLFDGAKNLMGGGILETIGQFALGKSLLGGISKAGGAVAGAGRGLMGLLSGGTALGAAGLAAVGTQGYNLGEGWRNRKENARKYGTGEWSAFATDSLYGLGNVTRPLGINAADMVGDRKTTARTISGLFGGGKEQLEKDARRKLEHEQKVYDKALEYEKKHGAGSGFGAGLFKSMTSDAISVSRKTQEDRIMKLQEDLLRLLLKNEVDKDPSGNTIIINGGSGGGSTDSGPTPQSGQGLISSLMEPLGWTEAAARGKSTSGFRKSSSGKRTAFPQSSFAGPTNVSGGRGKDPKPTPEMLGWINKYSEKFGVDADVIYQMMKQESQFNVNALSHKGARGLMQLMPATAAELGVDPSNPEDVVRGGVQYYAQKLKETKGNQEHALAAYNAGYGAVRKYGGVPPYKETQDYVKIISNGAAKMKAERLQALNADQAKARSEASVAKNSSAVINAPTTNLATSSAGRPAFEPSSRNQEVSFATIQHMSRRGDALG